MKLLVLSDVPDKKNWDYYKDGDLDQFDLILSAGDLPPQYLSYIVTFARCPVFYIHGNHDDCYEERPPEGCICIDGKIVNYKGIRILGFGGSARYKPGVNQYTENEMRKRVRSMKRKIAKQGGFDVLLTHAPAAGLGDGRDHVNKGFECFRELIETHHPKYHFYGHQHINYGGGSTRKIQFGDTVLLNATKSIIVDYEEGY